MLALRAFLVAALLLVALLDRSTVTAQVVPNRSEHRSAVAVTLRASEPEGVRLELYDPDRRPPRDLPAAVCFDRCELSAVPGQYLLRVSGPPGSDVRASRRAFELRESSVVTIDPPSSIGRYLGLGLGAAGPVLILGALFLTVNSTYLTGERDQPYYTLGIGSLIGGLVATPVGWIMFGENGRPEVDVHPSRSG